MSSDEQMFDHYDQQFQLRLAESLGISHSDLDLLNYEINTNESSDGLIYNYVIEFKDDSPKEILKKISGLEEGRYVYLDPWDLDIDEYQNDQFEAITSNKEFFLKFKDEITNIKANLVIVKDDPRNITVLTGERKVRSPEGCMITYEIITSRNNSLD